MVLHRNTTYIEAKAPHNSNVYNRGDVIILFKSHGWWHGYNTVDGTSFQTVASAIRTIPDENVIVQDDRVLSVAWKLAH